MHRPSRGFPIRVFAAALCVMVPSVAVSAQPVCGRWSPLADGFIGGFPASGPRISDMVAFDDGTGVRLYVAGNFGAVLDPVLGEVHAPGLARWDGTAWSAVPGLVGPGNELDGRAAVLEVWDDGTGPALYVGGDFTTAAGIEANGLARWDGTAWSTLGDPATAGLFGRVLAIQPHDFGDGEDLYVGGALFFGPGEIAPGVFRWNGTAWAPAGDNAPGDAPVYDLASFGGDLYASGPFQFPDSDRPSGMARFDGVSWSVPAGPGQEVLSIEFWPLLSTVLDGRDVLVAGGRFAIFEGGEPIARSLAAWDGARWISLDPEPPVRLFQPIDIVAFDDGSGESLFVGGGLVTQDDAVGRLRDGVMRPLPGLGRFVAFSLYAFDDGTGPALYAGGDFQDFPGGRTLLARWQPTLPCPVDINGDCRADVFDFLAFQTLFSAGNPAADFDGDGALTIFDFLAFQAAFDLGC